MSQRGPVYLDEIPEVPLQHPPRLRQRVKPPPRTRLQPYELSLEVREPGRGALLLREEVVAGREAAVHVLFLLGGDVAADEEAPRHVDEAEGAVADFMLSSIRLRRPLQTLILICPPALNCGSVSFSR